MGTSTDAKLAWGVDLGGDELPAWLWKVAGVKPGLDADTWDLTQALNKIGLDLAYHCSDACPMHVLCVNDSQATAWRGQPVRIDSLDVPAKWREVWKRVEAAGEPAWLLFSWWS